MESALTIKLLVTALAFVGLAAIAGYAGQTIGITPKQKGMGAALLGLAALIGSGLCLIGIFLGQKIAENTGGWVGLVVGMILAGFAAPWLPSKLAKGQSKRFFTGFWFAVCALGIYSYVAGGWLGLWLITPATLCAFWYVLYRLSAYILPIHEKMVKEEKNTKEAWITRLLNTLTTRPLGQDFVLQNTVNDTNCRVNSPSSTRGPTIVNHAEEPKKHVERQHPQAFRCLLTFTMGTNYPYYFVKDGKTEERVKGNPFLQFFAGPGITYVPVDHAAYVTDSVRITGVFDPGLHFTRLYDQEPRALDLRSQLRAFHVDALTKDGVPIRVLVFAPFQLRRGKHGKVSPQVELGKSFPFRRRTALYIASEELSERARRKEQSTGRHQWDQELVPVLVTPIVQDIIGRYSIDELCAPLDPDRDPRVEIVDEMKRRVKQTLWTHGIELIGGGISNLIPQDETVIQRRIDNWKTEWERRILLLMGEGKAERTRQIERARAEAEAEIVLKFCQVIEESTMDGNISQTVLALRFIDCLGEIVSETDSQWPLPEGTEDTLKCLRGELEEGPR